MPNLNHYRKQKYPTIKAFAEAAGLTYNMASWWLRAKRPDLNPEPLYTLLGMTIDEYYDAYETTQQEEDAKWEAKHPPLTPEQQAIRDAEFKASCDAIWAKMTPAEKRRVHEDAVKLGVSVKRRSPLDIMIDRACGLE